MESKLTRRVLLKGALYAIAAIIVVSMGYFSWYTFLKPTYDHIPCQIQGPDYKLAHRLWHMDFSAPSTSEHYETVIIGGGISGLSAARHLYKRGRDDFVVLELGKQVGGNSVWGVSSSSQFPWGAHYLPIPGEEQSYLFEFLEEAGVMTRNDAGVEFNELYVCHDPTERCWINGKWQEGMIPKHGLTPEDILEIDRFFALMNEYRQAKGKDGLYAFAIPTAFSSKDSTFTKLDQLSMAQYLNGRGFSNPYLLWYINYCCRDDYGAGIDVVSAWAGIHYFASRRRQIHKKLAPDSVLTWPEGNGFLVKKLVATFSHKILYKQLVYRVMASQKGGFDVYVFDAHSNRTRQIHCQNVICSVPQFVAAKLLDNTLCTFPNLQKKHYSPWLVANLTLDEIPREPGVPVAWDNVSYYSPSLGYIRAKNQNLSFPQGSEIITYYRPLDNGLPSHVRRESLTKSPEQWRDFIMKDLSTFLPEAKQHVKNIDVWIWGHGMIVPTVGHLHDAKPKVHVPNFYLAHSDLGGLSIFEEAYWQGLKAAQKIVGE